MKKVAAKKKKILRHEGHLLGELDRLAKMEQFLEDVGARLTRLYAKVYPKKCHSCGATYYSRDEYLKATLNSAPLDPDHSSMTIPDEDKFMEFRNCPCGAALVVIMESRRDQTVFGQRRRELFKRCVKKLMEKEGLKKEEAISLVRYIFRYCISRNGLRQETERGKLDKVG